MRSNKMNENEKTRLYLTLDRIEKRMDSVDVTLIEQHISLKEHMKRSDLLEKKQERDRKEIEDQVKPVVSHVQLVNAGLKLFGLFCGVISIVAGVLKIVEFFSHH